MKFVYISTLLTSLAAPILAQDDMCSTTWKCHSTTTPPVLDADFADWSDVEPYTTTLVNTMGQEYEGGTVTYKCVYDEQNIYFAMEIPGEYKFNSTDKHYCAAIGTMMKIGSMASYVNMGGCPDAMGGCPDGVPDTCSDYRVDIGAHWELKDTEQSTLYGLASSQASNRQGGTGNDLIANNDDEYAVSPFCRFDDDDEKADNEWSGAWAHSNPVDGEMGNYHFEVSRTLTTASEVSDKQLVAGETIQFGIAYWDPLQTEMGWNDIGHFVTGCGTKWIDLELVAAGSEMNTVPAADTPAPAPVDEPEQEPESSAFRFSSPLAILALVAGLFV